MNIPQYRQYLVQQKEAFLNIREDARTMINLVGNSESKIAEMGGPSPEAKEYIATLRRRIEVCNRHIGALT